MLSVLGGRGQVEVALLPGKRVFQPLYHLYDKGEADIDAACAWLCHHQHRIVPRDAGFLLPDFAAQVPVTAVPWPPSCPVCELPGAPKTAMYESDA